MRRRTIFVAVLAVLLLSIALTPVFFHDKPDITSNENEDTLIVKGIATTYNQVKADNKINTKIISSNIVDNDLIITLRHSSNKKQPVQILGNVNYSINNDFPDKNEVVKVTVFDWDNEYFKIVVGTSSDEFIFGDAPVWIPPYTYENGAWREDGKKTFDGEKKYRRYLDGVWLKESDLNRSNGNWTYFAGEFWDSEEGEYVYRVYFDADSYITIPYGQADTTYDFGKMEIKELIKLDKKPQNDVYSVPIKLSGLNITDRGDIFDLIDNETGVVLATSGRVWIKGINKTAINDSDPNYYLINYPEVAFEYKGENLFFNIYFNTTWAKLIHDSPIWIDPTWKINSSGADSTWGAGTFYNMTEDLGSGDLKLGIFADDFDDGDYAGWSVYRRPGSVGAVDGTWTASNNYLEFSGGSSSSWHSLRYGTNLSSANFMFLMDFNISVGDFAGMLFRDTGTAHYNNFVDIDNPTATEYHLRHIDTQIVENYGITPDIASNTYYEYRTDIYDGTIDFYIDGTLKNRSTGNTEITSGYKIAVLIYQTGSEIVAFDNKRVVYLDSSGNPVLTGNWTSATQDSGSGNEAKNTTVILTDYDQTKVNLSIYIDKDDGTFALVQENVSNNTNYAISSGDRNQSYKVRFVCVTADASYTCAIESITVWEGSAAAAPDITAWENNITNDNSTTLTMNETDSILFNITVDSSVNYTWYKNGTVVGSNQDNWTWNTNSSTDGIWNITVKTNNSDGSDSQEWTLTITEEIQVLIDALPSSGGTVTLEARAYYLFSSSPTGCGSSTATANYSVCLNISNVTIQGAGWNTKIYFNNTQNGFLYVNSSVPLTNLTLKDFSMEAGSIMPQSPGGTLRTIWILNVSNILIDGIRSLGTNADGLYGMSINNAGGGQPWESSGLIIKNSFFSYNRGGPSISYINGDKGTNMIYNNTFGKYISNDGLDMNSLTYNFSIYNNTFTEFSHLRAYGLSGNTTIRNNMFEKTSVGGNKNYLLALYTGGGTASDATIAIYNNIFRLNANDGDEIYQGMIHVFAYYGEFDTNKTIIRNNIFHGDGVGSVGSGGVCFCPTLREWTRWTTRLTSAARKRASGLTSR